MALGSLFKKLLLGDAAAETTVSEAISYKGFEVEAAPINEDGKYRTAGYISGELDGETRRIQFIRADQSTDLNTAVDHSLTKARQIIDEQGNSLLKKTHL